MAFMHNATRTRIVNRITRPAVGYTDATFHSMPFTVSHVAAALPLRRLNLVWSAFVVGSMAPDFPYIVGTTDYRSLGHQFPGRHRIHASGLPFRALGVSCRRQAAGRNLAAQRHAAEIARPTRTSSTSAALPVSWLSCFPWRWALPRTWSGMRLPIRSPGHGGAGLGCEVGLKFRCWD